MQTLLAHSESEQVVVECSHDSEVEAAENLVNVDTFETLKWLWRVKGSYSRWKPQLLIHVGTPDEDTLGFNLGRLSSILVDVSNSTVARARLGQSGRVVRPTVNIDHLLI